jgi:hypothetical protein
VNTILIAIVACIAFLGAVIPLLLILYRMHVRLQRDQNVLLSEILARRTLEETGNVSFAGQMLAHSNAHGMRTEMPQVWMPQVWTPPEPIAPREELQTHEEHAVLLGDMDLERPEE